MTDRNVITINGKHYDAITGKLLGAHDSRAPKRRSVDGVTPKITRTDESVVKSSSPIKPQVHGTGKAHDIILARSVHSNKSVKPLMRRGVTKPLDFGKPIKHVQSPAKTNQLLRNHMDLSVQKHNADERNVRAQEIHQHQMVKRFHQPSSSDSLFQPAKKFIPLPAQAKKDKTPTHRPNTTHLQDIITIGLNKATSHEQPSVNEKIHRRKHKKSKIWKLNVSVAVLAIVLIIGFVILRSIPTVEVRIASVRSGVDAGLPSYLPKGFRFEAPIRYGQGSVTLSFTSANGTFRLTEQNSNWDSLSLKDSFVNQVDASYQVVQASGRIVYLYDKGNATWVNSGIWYLISDNAHLSSSTLLKVATSL